MRRAPPQLWISLVVALACPAAGLAQPGIPDSLDWLSPEHATPPAEFVGSNWRAQALTPEPLPSVAVAAGDGVWSNGPGPKGPSARYFHSVIYDEQGHRIIVFGGFGNYALNSLATLDPSTGIEWDWPTITGALPSGRYGHAAIYDPARQRMLVFGGYDGSYRNDVWQLSLSGAMSWSPVTTVGTPPDGRYGSSVVYDPARDRLLVFGGYNGTLLNDVWELSLSGTPTWSALTPSGTRPSGRNFASVILDPSRDRLVVIDGYTGSYPQEVWQLTLGSGGAWSSFSPSGGPPSGRSGSVAVFDAAGDRVLMHAGRGSAGDLDDLWELKLHDPPAWNLLASGAAGPGQRSFHAGAIETDRARFVVVSGIRGGTAISDAWEQDLTQPPQWLAKSPDPTFGVSPSARHSFDYGYDATAGRMIMTGGVHAGNGSLCGRLQYLPVYHSDTWILTLGAIPQWQLATTSGAPPLTEGAASTWDPVRRRLIHFGGEIEEPFVCDGQIAVWKRTPNNNLYALSLDGTSGNWTKLNPPGTLPGLTVGASAIYDPVQDRMLVFGGEGTNLTFELPLGSPPVWNKLTISGTLPANRSRHSAIYDPVRNRMIVFGGEVSGSTNELWALQLGATPNWTKLNVAGPPSARKGHTAVYDPTADRMLVFSGYGSPYGDVWALEFTPTLRWRLLTPSGDTPLGRFYDGTIFDQGMQRMVVFGGISSATALGDTWTLNFDNPTPVRLFLFRSDARSDAVNLIWEADGGRPASATIERRESSGSWEGIAQADFDGLGRLEFEDRDVRPGHRYGYRLVPIGAAEDGAQGETWVEIPAKDVFALIGVSPNPAVRPLQLNFTSTADAPVVVELLDIGGRTLLRHDLGIMSAGTHVRTIEESSRLPAGVYFVRLHQADRTASARVSIVH